MDTQDTTVNTTDTTAPIASAVLPQGLQLAAKWFPLYREGKKTIDVRKGRRDVQLGQLTFTTPDNTDSLVVNVVSVTYKRYQDVTVREARDAGGKNKGEFKKELKEYYPKFRDSDEVTLIEVELVK